jgi:predicted cupin superfamily sugar epimerase
VTALPSTAEVIRRLDLAPHPEGGHYRELYRSSSQVHPDDGRSVRAALTTIYFLLGEGEVSRWHRVLSDEVWHFYDGAPLTLLTADHGFAAVERRQIGSVRDGLTPEAVVPAGAWQAAASSGAWTLVGCVVAPGFAFADFSLLQNHPECADVVRTLPPDLAAFL